MSQHGITVITCMGAQGGLLHFRLHTKFACHARFDDDRGTTRQGLTRPVRTESTQQTTWSSRRPLAG